MLTSYRLNAFPDTHRDRAHGHSPPAGPSLDTLTWQPGDERSSPPPKDFNPSDGDVPYRREPRFEGDLSPPEWLRGIGESRQFWCGYCKPGRWLRFKSII
ncbi:hypothetical protein QBC37DRAFT_329411 [Rhypophila decipiens]|uniref:Uncharacterized protein n=1 Tax=Rhypophila decipiens TaxID=261697 RepID=A0AAN7B071_9PEZI|nr:hypothetical protein QBC37DRAFT_329411 [Rhypophila decipiens]